MHTIAITMATVTEITFDVVTMAMLILLVIAKVEVLSVGKSRTIWNANREINDNLERESGNQGQSETRYGFSWGHAVIFESGTTRAGGRAE